jgi:hypothetical protein
LIPSKFLEITPYNIFVIALYGILLDLIFRKTMVFESLRGYYDNLSYFWSGVWGAIPLLLPLLFYGLFRKIRPFGRLNSGNKK